MSAGHRLLLVRHAEPEDTSRGRCYGSLDVALSPTGLAQAERLAVALDDVELAAVCASPRRRTVDTAAALARPRGLPVVELDGMRELDFGELEGRTYEEIEAERPALFRQWMEAPTTVAFPGGERYPQLRDRVLESLTSLRRRHRGESVAVVAHGGSIRAALAVWLGMPDEAIFRLGLDYAGVTVVDWFGDEPLVRVVNGREPLAAF